MVKLLEKIGKKMKNNLDEKTYKVAVLASGTGSNLQVLIDGADIYEIALVITDQPDVMARERAERAGIAAYEILPRNFSSKVAYEAEVVARLQEADVDLVVLAGYMRIVGETLLASYEGAIINLHPSLLPAFQGLDAQGQALAAGVKITGATMHFVDAGLDTGPIIMQEAVSVDYADDITSLIGKIQKVEHKIIRETVRLLAQGRVVQHGRLVEILD